jgi:hypothetical protein
MMLEGNDPHWIFCLPGWWWRNFIFWSSGMSIPHPASFLVGAGMTLLFIALLAFPLGILLALLGVLLAEVF